jgi:hypothetical protein
MKSRAVLAAIGILGALLAGGCASIPNERKHSDTMPTSHPYGASLAFPDRLAPVAGDPGAQSWRDPAVDFRKYKRFLIERIRVRLDPDSSAVDPNDLKALTDYFHQALAKALQPQYPIADKTGPDVLRVRITILDLVATKVEGSVVALLVPYATIPDMMSGAAGGGGAGSPPYLGRTGIAVEFLDGGTGAVVGEFADTRFGQKYVVDTSQGVTSTVTTGVADYMKAYSTWSYAQQAFDQWSARFRKHLDAINGR